MLIKNYLYTVSTYLNGLQKKDLLMELEANLYDQLEKRYGDCDYSDEQIMEVLKENGSPQDVATAFQPDRGNLIGTELVDLYWLVVKIALISVFVSTGIAAAFDLSIDTWSVQMLIKWFLRVMAGAWQLGFTTYGVVTLIFVVLHQKGVGGVAKVPTDWTEKDLKIPPNHVDTIKVFDELVGLFFSLLFLGWLNYFSGQLAVFVLDQGQSSLITIINPDVFMQFLWVINALVLASIVMHVALLIQRKWTPLLRSISLGLSFLSLLTLVLLIRQPDLFDFSQLIAFFSVTDQARFNSLLLINLRLAVVVFVGLTAYEAVKHLLVLLKIKK